MARRYTRNELLEAFGNIHAKLAAAATAFLDKDCFEENLCQWVVEHYSLEISFLVACGNGCRK
jgi:hypothetical protein